MASSLAQRVKTLPVSKGVRKTPPPGEGDGVIPLSGSKPVTCGYLPVPSE